MKPQPARDRPRKGKAGKPKEKARDGKSSKSRKKARIEAEKSGKLGNRRLFLLASGIAAVLAMLLLPAFRERIETVQVVESSPTGSTTEAVFHQPATLEELRALSHEDLEKVDFVRMNLLCAQGLPGSENLDIEHCEKTIDEWAAFVRDETERLDYLYEMFPDRFPTVKSRAQWKMYVLFSVLKQRVGIHYNPDLVRPEYQDRSWGLEETNRATKDFYRDSRDYFLHGIVERQMGACVSLPSIVVAVARRLGYPVYLVNCSMHSFVRWDDGKERFTNR